MTTARTKSKTVKKKSSTTKKKAAPKKKPAAKKSLPKPISKPDKKKAAVAKPEARPARPEGRKAAGTKSAGPAVRDLAHENAARFQPQEARPKKAPKVRPSRAREPGKRPDLPLPTPVERPGGPSGALGEKYVCFSCGSKFYDLGKPEPRCPKCGADQREAPRQVRTRAAPVAEVDVVEERPVKRSRLLDEDEDEIVIDTDAEATDDLDLGLGVVDEGEDFGPDEPEEEEEPEEP
jgi:hypothetical protein